MEESIPAFLKVELFKKKTRKNLNHHLKDEKRIIYLSFLLLNTYSNQNYSKKVFSMKF